MWIGATIFIRLLPIKYWILIESHLEASNAPQPNWKIYWRPIMNDEASLEVLLNYGKVHITVGGSKMTFHDVFDPLSVQQDIDRRRMARNAEKEETKVKAERERLADWFLAYNEITKPEDEKNNESDQK